MELVDGFDGWGWWRDSYGKVGRCCMGTVRIISCMETDRIMETVTIISCY